MAKKTITAKAMADGTGEIRMYGEVTTYKDDFSVPEETITPKKFSDAVESLGDVSHITIHLNSVGGDAYAGLAISNAIKNLKAETEIIVDGIAASAGSVIMCAGDKITVTPSSIVMIHGASVGGYGWYNADDLEKMTQSVDAINRSLIAVYAARTGKSEDELADMISAETWLVGQEIIDAGFADELSDEQEPIKACVTVRKGRQILTVNDTVDLDISGVHNIPEMIDKKSPSKKCEEDEEKPAKKDDEPSEDGEEKEDDPESENACKKKKKCEGQEASALIQAAVMAERKRIQEIQSIAASITDKQMLHDAMFDPDKLCDARDLALRQLQAEAKTGQAFLRALESDYADSGIETIGSAPSGDVDPASSAKNAAADSLLAAVRKRNGDDK